MNKQFLTYLSAKLKTGNLRSIHLNALPGRYATRLDLTKLDLIVGRDGQKCLFESTKENISRDFLFNHILELPKFKFRINFEGVPFSNLRDTEKTSFAILAKRLNALFNENEDNYLEHGVKSFGLGYPLLVKRSKSDLSKIIKAPLLIWNLDIQRSNSIINQWTIEKQEDSPVYLNEVLISHLSSDENISLGEISSDLLEDNIINQVELQGLVRDVLRRLSAPTADVDIRIETCSDKEYIESISSESPWICWSGVFGLFRTQKQSIIKDIDTLIGKFEEFDFGDLKIEQIRTSLNSGIETDPSQEEIIETLDHNEYRIIQGPPGTGKSQSLTAIITNALENLSKVLVVCEKETALEVIFNNLRHLGLEKLVAFIVDVNSDRKRIIEAARETSNKVKYIYQGFNENEYDSKLKEYSELIKDVNKRHHNLLKNIFNGLSPKKIISRYLHLKRELKYKELLFEKIDFELSESDFTHIGKIIEEGSELYEEVLKTDQFLNLLSPKLFQGPYSIQQERQIYEQLSGEKQFIETIDLEKFELPEKIKFSEVLPIELKRKFSIKYFDDYLNYFNTVNNIWQQLYAELTKIKEHVDNASIFSTTSFYARVEKLFRHLPNIQRNTQIITKIISHGNRIQEFFAALPVNMKADEFEYKKATAILSFFSKEYSALYIFWIQIRKEIDDINQILSDTHIYASLDDVSQKIRAELPLDHDLKLLKKQLSHCIENNEYFQEYYNWRHFFETSDARVQSYLLKLVVNVPVNQWMSVFEFNYFIALMESQKIGSTEFNTSNRKLDKIAGLDNEIMSLQKHKILKLWEDNQFLTINKYNQKSNINLLFNHRKNKQYSRKNSLRSIIHSEFELFTDIFPIVLVNPVVCSSILPLQQSLFDIVIFDEASQLRLEETYPASFRGKIKVISGDKHQMPPSSYFATGITLEGEEEYDEESEEALVTSHDIDHPLYLAESESLLEFGDKLNSNIKGRSFLDFHYRSRHPYLIEFSNAAFYGSRLIPLPERTKYKPIRVIQTNGQYESNHTNPLEAQQIVDFLRTSYPKLEDGTYPSLGIATFNLHQRNLIKDLINEMSILDEKFRQKMDFIGEKETWFVKNLENIQGDERDIIIMSTTFGINADGKFRQNFGPLGTGKGYKLFNVIITRAKRQLYLFTSIPEEIYVSKYRDEIAAKGNNGKAIVYAYLDYCNSVEKDDDERRQEILKFLREHCEENAVQSENFVESPFEQEVLDYLEDYIVADRIIPQYKLGGYRIDFVLVDQLRKPIIAIECDGAEWHSSQQAYANDIHRQKIIEEYGLKFFRIWSKTWFPDPHKEMYKLLRFIELVDNSILKEIAKT